MRPHRPSATLAARAAGEGQDRPAAVAATLAPPVPTAGVPAAASASTPAASATAAADAVAGRPAPLDLRLPRAADRLPAGRSVAWIANESLGAGAPRDVLAERIQQAGRPDCWRDGVPGGLLGVPLWVYQASAGQCR